jgi:hypothetical protein
VDQGWGGLRNTDQRLLSSWEDFSRMSTKYVEGECGLWAHATRARGRSHDALPAPLGEKTHRRSSAFAAESRQS